MRPKNHRSPFVERHPLVVLVTLVGFLSAVSLSARADRDGPSDGEPFDQESEEEDDPDEDDDEGEDDDEETVRFVLPRLEVSPGEEFLVPLLIQTQAPVAMASWSVQYDGRFFEFLGAEAAPEVTPLMAAHPPEESLFEWFTKEHEEDEDEEDEEEHEQDEGGLSEDGEEDDPLELEESGWFQAVLVTDFQGREEFAVPAGEAVLLAQMRFRVHRDTPSGAYALEFSTEDDGRFTSRFEAEDGKLVYNVTGGGNISLAPGAIHNGSSAAGLENGTILVRALTGDIGIFRRGDANLDSQVDITDPLRTLRFLFMDPGVTVCQTTADADENGALELTDAVVVLGYLFLQGIWEPSPVTLLPVSGVETGPTGNGCTW